MVDRRSALAALSLIAGASAIALPSKAFEADPDDPLDLLWAVIDKARAISKGPSSAETDRGLVDAIQSELVAGGRPRIVGFSIGLYLAMEQSNRWDIWGAGYLVHGGLSDDGFVYFRAWLISRGRAVFTRALADPDSLAEAIPANQTTPLELEALLYADADAWGVVNARMGDDTPLPESVLEPGEPSGTMFSEDTLDRSYPRLFARFGRKPLM